MTRLRRIPRRSLHLQLTLLYAVPFLVCGVVLLAIPLLGTEETAPADSAVGPGSGGQRHLHQQLTTSAVGVVVLVVVSLALGWFVAGRFLRPLRTITATARDISATNLHRRLGRTGLHDEFTELAETLDELFGRLESSFDAQRFFVANASHELRTPLTAERTVLQVALADPGATTETLRAACHEVLALGEQQERLIGALLTLAEGQQPPHVRSVVDLADIAAEAYVSRLPEAERRGLEVEVRTRPAPVPGDPALIERLVTNLIDNAVRHNTTGGWIGIVTESAGDRSVLHVANSGPVIPPAELETLFQPFRQLGDRRTRQGNGLGLAIVRAIATSHGASITACPHPGGGLDIQVDFPISRRQKALSEK